MSIVLQLKNALEFARFSSPEIRDAFVTCIKELDQDLSEVEYEWTLNVSTAFRELNKTLTDFENSENDTSAEPIETDREIDAPEVKVEINSRADVDLDDVPEVYSVRDEVDRVIAAPSTVDDDDIEL